MPLLFPVLNINNNIYFKSLVLPGKEESLLCSYNFHILNCFKYNILTNETINIINILEIREYSFYYQSSFLFEYYEKTDEILIGFIEGLEPIIYISQCTKDLNCSDLKKQIFETILEPNSNFYLYPYFKSNIIIPLNLNHYYAFLLDRYELLQGILLKLNITNNYFSSFNSNSLDTYLLCDYYNNFEHSECLTTIPDGYYCNNSVLKTIDKCHDNCQTCNQGPSVENNHCLTCNGESINKYFDLGNCTSNCNLGYYIINLNTICKCSKDTKCGICTEESTQNNLCIT